MIGVPGGDGKGGDGGGFKRLISVRGSEWEKCEGRVAQDRRFSMFLVRRDGSVIFLRFLV
jgi:hypothetical protein